MSESAAILPHRQANDPNILASSSDNGYLLLRDNAHGHGFADRDFTVSQMLTRRAFLGLGSGLAALGSGTAAYAGYIEPSMRLVVSEYRPALPSWPADFPLTIAVIADLHAGGPNMSKARIREVVDTTNALGADLILNLGDHEAKQRFQTEIVQPHEWAGLLAELKAPLGVYTVLGNHDWWHNREKVRGAIIAAGLRLFENEALLLEKAGRRFWLAGLADQIAIYLGPSRFRGLDDLPGTLKQVTTDDPVVLMVHEPDIFVDVPDRVALTLAGHTHGGQIHIPGIPNPFIPSAYGERFRYGHIVEDNRHMIVSGGLGTSHVPVRFGVPPEIVLVRLGQA